MKFMKVFSLLMLVISYRVFALDVMAAAQVNWVGISSAGGEYKIECEVEKNGVKKYFYLKLAEDGSISDFAGTVYSTLLVAKTANRTVQIATDNGQSYIRYVYLKDS